MGRFLAILFLSLCLHAEEGMWTFNNFPSAVVGKKYGFAPTQQWLDRVRLSSVRLAEGCSASFVSPSGLLMTNHHCAATCIAQLSTNEKDYMKLGFAAQSPAGEVRCPRQEANVLVAIADVTARMDQATKGLQDKAANEARKAETARLEKECASSESVRCEVVPLYGGGIYNLYKYQRYQDVRLVFAPEFSIAFFGGDPDNFMFPRYNLDATFLRVFDNGQPLQTPQHFKWSKAGAKEGELTFISGHPGATNRQHTIAMLETERDFTNLHRLAYLSEYRGMLTQFQTKGPEQDRIAQDDLNGVENSLKVYKGRQHAMVDKNFFGQKIAAEREFQKRVQADAKLRTQYGKAWDDIAAVQTKFRALYYPYLYLERNYGFRSQLFQHALRLLRMADEFEKPNEKRLEEYADARKPSLRQAVLSPAPIYPELEIEQLTFSLTKMRELLGPDDPTVRALFGKRSPREIATGAVKNTRLLDAAARKALMEGGKQAVAGSHDSMVELARLVDPFARAARKRVEEDVESVLTAGMEKLSRARFAVYGTSLYPDATFTLRLSYGSVKGWTENGKAVTPFTIFGGAYERNTGSFPFALPQSWLDAKPKLDPQTRFNFVTNNDIIGGNSGSPVINKDAEIVGLVFDGNIHSLGGSYGFDDVMNRAVAVHSEGIREALRKVYAAERVLRELEQ
ncbi:MAG: S46 family peptidase [Bryobacterales bacterium]|nr:S46 family peptidase [Bryobacterales bacterium]